MSDSASKAVFLSYASQDAEAAKRICDALRAAGVEVWFDQSELRGGDSWDAKIRRQIKECALFVPIITANTNARAEGYFRREWKQAVERTHDMADDVPFLFPIVLGDVTDASARVPDKFRDVQWTRLRLDETPAELAKHVTRLLSGSGTEDRVQRTEDRPASRRHRPVWLRYAWAGVGLLFAVIYAVRPMWQAARRAEPKPAAAAAVSEIAQVRARIHADQWTQADFEAFSPLVNRLVQANPDSGDALALRSIINSLQVIRNMDAGTQPLEQGKEAADRALRLAPASPLAELALGMHLTAMISRGGDVQAAHPHIERGVAGQPADSLTRYAELTSYWLGYQFDETDRSARAWLAAEPGASFPAWILAQMFLARRQPVEAVKWAEQAAADPDITGVRAYVTLFEARYYLQADLPAARAALEKIPGSQRGVHRVLASSWQLAMAEHHYDQALQELARTPAAVLFDRVYHGPKALLAGLAHRAAGRAEAARAQFTESERLLREALAHDTENQELRAAMALTQACLGRSAEARAELAEVEPLLVGRAPSVYSGHVVVLIAETYAMLGDTDRMLPWLRSMLAKPSSHPFTPASLRIDPRFTGVIGEPAVQALLKEFAWLDQPTANAFADSKSVAVLAFANLSDDKANEYFSDGISEELLNVLAKVSGLKVTARTSSFHFKGMNTSIPEIAQQLGVAYVVEGSVRKAGDKVRITAQLIKAADGFHVWSDTFTRDLKDIFAVQDEIAGLIAQNLQLKLGMSAQAGQTANPEAHQLYLQGKYFLGRTTLEDTARATTLLQRAVELDPSFAQAWAALSGAGWFRGGYGNNRQDFDEGFALARRAADRAIALEPALAAGHIARFDVQSSIDFDWKGSLESLRQAQALAPNDPAVVFRAAQLAYSFGEEERATQLIRQAVALDPVNPGVYITQGYIFLAAHRFADAEAAFRHIVDISPAAPWGHAGMGMAMVARGQCDQAVTEAEQEVPEWSRLYVLSLARWGQKKQAEADAVLKQFIQANADVAAYQIATVYAHRGEPVKAFEWLERAYRQRDPGLSWAKVDFFLQSLHADPRWEAFMRKMGLADDQLK